MIDTTTTNYTVLNPLTKYQCRICLHFEHRHEKPDDFIYDDVHYDCLKQQMMWESHYNFSPELNKSFNPTEEEPKRRFQRIKDAIKRCLGIL